MLTALQIPRLLQQHCDGQPKVRLRGATVRALLAEVHRRYPALHQCICDETGSVRRHIHLFVNNDFLDDRHGLDTRLKSGDVVSVFQAVSGG